MGSGILKGKQRRVAFRVGFGLLAAVPLLVIIIPLLGTADEVFGQMLLDLPDPLAPFNLWETLFRAVKVLLVTCSSLLSPAATSRPEPGRKR